MGGCQPEVGTTAPAVTHLCSQTCRTQSVSCGYKFLGGKREGQFWNQNLKIWCKEMQEKHARKKRLKQKLSNAENISVFFVNVLLTESKDTGLLN